MSLAIKFGELSDPEEYTKGFIYIDATTEFDKVFSGRVTSHPVEMGASITDHFISENPKYRVAGVISGMDLSSIPSNIMLEGEPVMNANTQPSAAVVSDLNSSFRKFLPDSIEQFIPNISPEIIGGLSPRVDFKDQVEEFLETVMSGLYFNEERNRWENRMVLITLYETVGSFLGKSIPNLVMTSYSVKENVESGNSLTLDMSFERVRFATSEEAEAPNPQKGSDVEKSSAPTKDKGTVSTDAATGESLPNKDKVYSTEVSPTLGSIGG